MDLQALPKQVERFLRANSPAIMTGIGVSGVVTTAYLAHEAGRNYEAQDFEHKTFTRKDRFKIAWKFYIPPVIIGGISIGCIIGANRVGGKRTAAAAAAYSLSERAFTEYKEKVVEKLGERKEQTIRDDIAQDKVAKAAISRDTILLGSGTVMCFELHTGRPFLCDMETLKKAQNDVNWRVLNHDYATLADFYHFVGLGTTSAASDYGWTSDRQLELEFSTVLADETRPCLAFGYNYLKML